MSHAVRRSALALAVGALVLGGLSAVTLAPPAGAADGGWHAFDGTGFGAIPDGAPGCGTAGAPLEVTFEVTGVPVEQLADVEITGLEVNHDWMGDLSATLIGPGGGAQQTLFARTGATIPSGAGFQTDVRGPYRFTDHAIPSSGGWWEATSAAGTSGTVPAGDYYATSAGEGPSGGQPVSLTGPFSGLISPNGTWVLRFTDSCSGTTGVVTAARLELRTASERCTSEENELAFQEARLTATTEAVTRAAAADSAAARSVRAKTRAVTAAKRALRQAHGAAAKARARSRLANARLAQAKAQGVRTGTHQRLVGSSVLQSEAAFNRERAQGALAVCQAE